MVVGCVFFVFTLEIAIPLYLSHYSALLQLLEFTLILQNIDFDDDEDEFNPDDGDGKHICFSKIHLAFLFALQYFWFMEF